MSTLALFLILILWLPTALLLQSLIRKITKYRMAGTFQSELLIYVFTLAILSTLLLMRILGNDSASFAYAALLSLGLAGIYFHLINMSYTARRIQILIQAARLDAQTDQPTTEKNYSGRDMILLRLERLERLGCFKRDSGKITPLPSPIYAVASFVEIWRRALGFAAPPK